MKTATLITLLLGIAVAAPVGAQTPPPVRTKSFTHEWIQTSLFSDDSSGPDTGPNIQGKAFLEDVSGHHSRIEIFLRNRTTGELVVNCIGLVHIVPGGEFGTRDFNIVQVGPFAQQATGDLEPIQVFMDTVCPVPPKSFTLNCPYQGQPAGVDPQHVQFNHTGIYRAEGGAAQPTSYTLKGPRDDTFCHVEINDVEYFGIGFLTNIRDTRRGNVDNPVIFWELPNTPNHWLNLRELVEVFRQIAPPAQ